MGLHEEDKLMTSPLTIVTTLYDLGRDKLTANFSRPYSHYREKLIDLLNVTPDYPFVIFCNKQDQQYIKSLNLSHRIHFVVRELEEFKKWFEFFPLVQNIREKTSWKNQAGWLTDSPQSSLEMYNPLVMSKMFMMNDVTLMNPFSSNYFIWLDAGITTTIHPGYFSHDKVLNKITKYMDKFLFLSYPYVGNDEIHGFERPALHNMANTDYANYVCRGGLFGGSKQAINNFNGIYYHILKKSLSQDCMGTEESIFTIMAHLHPERINRFMLSDNGLISTFCEAVKNDNVVFEQTEVKKPTFTTKIKNSPSATTSIYVLTYNFPGQFSLLIDSFESQPEFLTKTRKICIDNSTDMSAAKEIEHICKTYKFEYLHQEENLGICGGRKFAAYHFSQSPQKYYIFFEDDMRMVRKGSFPCKCGFITYVPDLYKKIHTIMDNEKFDFLKLSFAEFYMDNSIAVSWYNVPPEARKQLFPQQPIKLDNVEVPKTTFKNITCINGLSYVTGDIFYCNWPLILNQDGNRKIFFEPEYAYPYEQTVMSHAYQQTIKGIIKPACLLASPIEHDRLFYYDESLRKEC